MYSKNGLRMIVIYSIVQMIALVMIKDNSMSGHNRIYNKEQFCI